MVQRDGFGYEVKLGLLTREVLESYYDKDQYKEYIDNILTTHKYYNVLDKQICHVYPESHVKEQGWELPDESGE